MDDNDKIYNLVLRTRNLDNQKIQGGDIMKKVVEIPLNNESLRKKAEKKLKSISKVELEVHSVEDAARLIQELRIHQVELEMQNEELKRAHNELAESRVKYSDLYDFAPVGYFTFDENGLILEVNLTGAGLLGIERSHLIKKPFSQYIGKDNQDIFFLHRRKVFDTKERQTCEVKIKKKNATEFYAQLESMAVKDSDGNFSQCRTVVTDISRRRRFMEELIESETRFRTLFEQAGVGVAQVMSETGQFVRINKRYCDIVGYSRNKIVKLAFQEIMHPDDLQAYMNNMQLLIKGEIRKFSMEKRYLHKNGSIIWVNLTVSPMWRAGETPYYHIAVVEDITARKKAENDLQKSRDELKMRVEERTADLKDINVLLKQEISERNQIEKALENAKAEIEAWNRELEIRVKDKTDELLNAQAQMIQSEKLAVMGELVGGLAHELNSPLAGLLPLLKAFRARAEKGSADHKELSLMSNAAEHMARIIKNFGVFSRKTKGIFTTLSLNEVIEDTLSFSEVKLRHKGIKIKKDLNGSLPLVKGDKTGLQQVVLNMITNACYAMDEGGMFVIKTDVSEDKRWVIMEFTDNGAGIDKENINKIFDPFFTTKISGEGIGLGLSVSYEIIKKHDGEITVESKPGKGTRFSISLPAVKSSRSRH